MKRRLIHHQILIALICVFLLVGLGSYTHAAAKYSGNGIRNNGVYEGITINIYSNAYTSIAGNANSAYLSAGCTWFVSGRVFELTGKKCAINGPNYWYNTQGPANGFTSTQTLPRTHKSIICTEGRAVHVGIVEYVYSDGSLIVSEGGCHLAPNNDYCNIGKYSSVSSYMSTMGLTKLIGYVDLGVANGQTVDTVNPVVNTSSISVTNVSYTGYNLSVKVTDNVGVTQVQFPTWTPDKSANGTNQDDLVWHNATMGSDGTTWSCRINTSQHNNEYNCRYVTDIYAYDAAGNCATYKTVTINVPSNDTTAPTITKLRDFCYTSTSFALRGVFYDNVAPTRAVFTVTCSGITKNYEQHDLVYVSSNYYNADVSVPISDFGNARGVNYTCTITVYDAAGNHSSKTSTISFPAEDISSPSFNEIEVRYDTLSVDPEYRPLLKFSGSDDVGVAKAWVAFWPATYGNTYNSSYSTSRNLQNSTTPRVFCDYRMDPSEYNNLRDVEYIVQIWLEDAYGNQCTTTYRFEMLSLPVARQTLSYTITGDGTDLHEVEFNWVGDNKDGDYTVRVMSQEDIYSYDCMVGSKVGTTTATMLVPAGIYNVRLMTLTPDRSPDYFTICEKTMTVPGGSYIMGTAGPMQEGNHKLYKIYKTSNTWLNARGAAIQLGGRLAVIDSAAAQSAISRLMSGVDYNAWIGGYCTSFTSGFYGYKTYYDWLPEDMRFYGGSRFSFSNWDSGFPVESSNKMLCVQITPEGYWQSIGNEEIDKSGGYIMEYDPVSMDVTCDTPFIPVDALIGGEMVTVGITYSDGTRLEVDDFELSLSANEVGAQTLTVTYGDLSHTVDVTVFTPMGSPDFVLPESLVTIDSEAFYGLPMQVVMCPEGLRTIGTRAFGYCTNLKEIYIPDSVNSIATTAFDGCSGLTIFGKVGSEAQSFAQMKGFTFIGVH